jgi:hypothetical protein
MSCTTCFTDWICKCVPYNDFIEVRSLLTPATEYFYKITDKFNAIYSGAVTSTADGYLEIPIADFPDGYFNEYAGNFTLEIYTDADLCNRVQIPLVSSYECVTIEIKGGTTEKNTIGCEP